MLKATPVGPSRRRLRARIHHFAVLPVRPHKQPRFGRPAYFLDQPLSGVADDGSVASELYDVDDYFDEAQLDFGNVGNEVS